MIPNHTVYCALPRLISRRGSHPWHVCKYSQTDYTGAHFHAHGWTTLQKLFILHLLRREILLKFNMTRQFSLHGQTSVVIRANTVNWGLPTNLLQYTMMTSAFVSNCSFDNVIAQYDTMITSACREMTSANSVRQRCKNDAMITSAKSNFHPNID